MNRTLPILIAAILAISVFATASTQSANAALSQARVGLYVVFVGIDGSRTGFVTGTPASPFALINSKNLVQIAYIELSVKAVTTNASDRLTAVSYINPTVTVQKRDGTYASVPVTNVVSGTRNGDAQIAPIIWQVYSGRISPSDIENILGDGPSYDTELRISTGSPITLQGTIGSNTGSFNAAPLSLSMAVSKTAGYAPVFTPTTPATSQSPTDIATTPANTPPLTPNEQQEPPVVSQPVTSDSVVVKPTGKIYHTFSIKYVDGHQRNVVSTKLKTFSVFASNDPTEGSNLIDSVTYRLWLVLDNDVFSIPNQVTYTDCSVCPNNYDITVNGKGIAKDVDPTITRTGPQFQLLRMTVKAADIQGALAAQPGGLSTGTLEVNIRSFMIRFAGTTGTYDVSVPQQHLSLDLNSMDAGQSDKGCTIDGSNTCAPTPKGVINNNLLIGVIGGVAGLAVLGVVAKKKKFRR